MIGFPASRFVEVDNKWLELGRQDVPTAVLHSMYDKILYKQMTLELTISYKRLGIGENRVQFVCTGVILSNK